MIRAAVQDCESSRSVSPAYGGITHRHFLDIVAREPSTPQTGRLACDLTIPPSTGILNMDTDHLSGFERQVYVDVRRRRRCEECRVKIVDGLNMGGWEVG